MGTTSKQYEPASIMWFKRTYKVVSLLNSYGTIILADWPDVSCI